MLNHGKYLDYCVEYLLKCLLMARPEIFDSDKLGHLQYLNWLQARTGKMFACLSMPELLCIAIIILCYTVHQHGNRIKMYHAKRDFQVFLLVEPHVLT